MSENDGPKRNDSKQKAEARNQLRNIMAVSANALDLFMRHLPIWEDADAKEFNEKACTITCTPTKHPCCKEESTIFNIDHLTKRITSFVSKRLAIMSPLVDNSLLHVTHVKANTVQSQYTKGRSLKIQKWKFTTIDGDRDSIIHRLDNFLNADGNMLCTGT